MRRLVFLSFFGAACLSVYGQSSDPLDPIVSGKHGFSIKEQEKSFKKITKLVFWILMAFALCYSVFLMVQGDVKKGFTIFLFSGILVTILWGVIKLLN